VSYSILFIAGKRRHVVAAVASLMLMLLTAAATAQPIVYPAKGQNQGQQEQDQFSCYSWAKQQTGFDPTVAPQTTAAPPPARGGVVPGAAKGATIGAIGGAIGGNAGKGAAIGATTGAVFGGMRRAQSEQQRAAYAQQQNAQYEQARSSYNRAFAACMEGRGYTVK